MNNPDVWAAFESTPPPIEPVANRDNSLQGFQRRLLAQCGEDLGIATQLLDRCHAMLYGLAGNYVVPEGLGDLLVDLADFKDRGRG
jgi:hypothetical protein